MNASTSLLELVGFDARKVGDLWLTRLAQEAVFGSLEHRERLTAAMHTCLLEVIRAARAEESDATSDPMPLDVPRLPTASALQAVELLADAMLEAAAQNGVEPAVGELHQLAMRVAQRISENLVAHANPDEQSAHDWVQTELLRLAFEREQLAQRSDLLTATLEQLPAGVAIADASGRILLASKEFQRALGEGEMRLEHIQDYDGLCRDSGGGANGRRRRPGPLARALGKGRAVRHELLEIQRPAKGRTLVDLSAAPVTGHHINAAVALVEDVTERQRQTHELKQLWQLSSDLLCVIGLDAYFKQVNPAFVRTLGHTEDELLRTPFWEFVYPDDRNNTLLEMRRSAQGIPTIKLENRYRCKDGTYKWLSWSAVPVLAEQVSYAIAREISSERMLRDGYALLARFTELAAASSDGDATLSDLARVSVPMLADCCLVDVVGSDGRLSCVDVAHADPAASALLTRLRGISPRRSAHPAVCALRNGQLSVSSELTPECLRGMANDATHLGLLTALGPKAIVAVPLLHGRESLGVLTLIMAESNRAYAPEDLMIAKELAHFAAGALSKARSFKGVKHRVAFEQRLLALVSHDLRSPLTAISMTIDAMLAGELPQDGEREHLLIRRSVRRALGLLSDLLDVARARLGTGIPLQPRTIDLTELVESIAEEARSSHPGARIDVETEGELVGTWDGGRIAQVVANLLANALIHGKAGSVATIRLRGTVDAVEIAVHNFGKAIPAQAQSTLFDAMHSEVDGAPLRGGLGLGLFIAKQIVVAHSGSIGVKPRFSEGTTFTVRLPRQRRNGGGSMALSLPGPA